MIASGLVIENGGVLSFGACMSREHGMPAVTLDGALRNIPDGALVRVDGDAGHVTRIEVAGAAVIVAHGEFSF